MKALKRLLGRPGPYTTQLSFFGLPKEIRLQIFAYVVETDDLRAGRWLAHGAFGTSRQVREEAILAVYRTRDLIFDLPDFVPHRLQAHEWPSTIRVRDQYSAFAVSIAPRFLCQGTIDIDRKYRILKNCPFHLFRAVRIEIRPPNPKDPAELIMTWNRLRFIARLLNKAVQGLPHVQLVFSETDNRTWSNDGKLILSHPVLSNLSSAHTDTVSDLMLLISVFTSLRCAHSITVKSPSLDRTCWEYVQYLKTSSMKACEWGKSTHHNGDEWYWIKWQEPFKLHFHRLVHNLDTPIAPFLRLEQRASLTHLEIYKFRALSDAGQYADLMRPYGAYYSLRCFSLEVNYFDYTGENTFVFNPFLFKYIRASRPIEHLVDEGESEIFKHLTRILAIYKRQKRRSRGSITSHWRWPSWTLKGKQGDLRKEDIYDIEEYVYNRCTCFSASNWWIQTYPEGVARP